jgi:hypothetical protein
MRMYSRSQEECNPPASRFESKSILRHKHRRMRSPPGMHNIRPAVRQHKATADQHASTFTVSPAAMQLVEIAAAATQATPCQAAPAATYAKLQHAYSMAFMVLRLRLLPSSSSSFFCCFCRARSQCRQPRTRRGCTLVIAKSHQTSKCQVHTAHNSC